MNADRSTKHADGDAAEGAHAKSRHIIEPDDAATGF
jgi:hypothetical protein